MKKYESNRNHRQILSADTEQRHILLIHSLSVAQKALKIVDAHPNLPINRSFVREAALLHDIGIL